MYLWVIASICAAFVLLLLLWPRNRREKSEPPVDRQRSAPRPRPTPPKIAKEERAEKVRDVRPRQTESAKPPTRTPAVEPVLGKVHESYMPVQKRAIHAVFNRLGIPFIPALLTSLLRQHDARYALFHFCGLMNVEYDALMDPSNKDHLKARDALKYAAGFLIEVEETAKSSGLNPEPVYSALKESLENAERLLDRFRRAARAVRQLQGVRLTFEPVKALLGNTLAGFKAWDTLGEDVFEQAEVVAKNLADYEERFGKGQHIINESLREINSARSTLKDTLRQEFDALRSEHEKLLRELGISDGQFEERLERFTKLAQRFYQFAHRVKSEPKFHDWAKKGALTFEKARTMFIDFCVEFSVKMGGTLSELKVCYRRLALELHPDRNPRNPHAKEKFQQLNAAYQVLTSQWTN